MSASKTFMSEWVQTQNSAAAEQDAIIADFLAVRVVDILVDAFVCAWNTLLAKRMLKSNYSSMSSLYPLNTELPEDRERH